jgi:hypothetical protein
MGRHDVRRARWIVLSGLVIATPRPTWAQAGEAHPAIATFGPGEGFVLKSRDDNYRLRVGVQAVYRSEPRYVDGKSQDRTAIYSARPSLAGSVVRPWIAFLMTAELAANPPYLLYAYIDARPIKELGVRFGQQDTPFSRHENYGLYRVLFPETGPVSDYFWSGRDKGITVYGSFADRLDYFAGFFGGSPLRQFTTIAGNYEVQGRVTVNPMGKMSDAEFAYAVGDGPVPTRISFTLQGYGGRIQSATENFDTNSFLLTPVASGMTTMQETGGADVFLQSSRVVFLSEVFLRSTSPSDASSRYTSVGAWGQVGVLLYRRVLDAAASVGWTNPSTSLSHDRLLGGEGQVVYYVAAPTLILKLRYAYFDQQTPGSTALETVTLPAMAGTTQLITLQANLNF